MNDNSIRDPNTVNCRIYVGNLKENTPKNELQSIFSKYGNIRGVMVSRNFGFVQFDSEANQIMQSRTKIKRCTMDERLQSVRYRVRTKITKNQWTKATLALAPAAAVVVAVVVVLEEAVDSNRTLVINQHKTAQPKIQMFPKTQTWHKQTTMPVQAVTWAIIWAITWAITTCLKCKTLEIISKDNSNGATETIIETTTMAMK